MYGFYKLPSDSKNTIRFGEYYGKIEYGWCGVSKTYVHWFPRHTKVMSYIENTLKEHFNTNIYKIAEQEIGPDLDTDGVWPFLSPLKQSQFIKILSSIYIDINNL